MNKRLFCAVAWAISSCIYLWLFSLAQVERSDPPTVTELFDSFIVFSVMLLGGGGCYHLLTEIALSPVNASNSNLWSRLCWVMGVLMTTLISAPVIIILCREYLSGGLGWGMSYVYLLATMSLSIWLFVKIEHYFKRIRGL